MYVAALFVALIVTSGGSERCPSPKATQNLGLSIGSHRNATGHWLFSIDVLNDNDQKPLSRVQRLKDIDVRLVHGASSCENSEQVHMNALATVSSGLSSGPPVDYEPLFGLGYYKLHTAALTWADAESKCEEESAHLIIANSAHEADVIKTLYARNLEIKGAETNQGHLCHVGFNDHKKEGEFVSVLGDSSSSVGYFRWGAKQPSGGASENCLVSDSAAIYWDAPCAWKLRYICEYQE